MFPIAGSRGYLTQGLTQIRQSADSTTTGSTPMLTITITFALLVALWGFSGAITSFIKRSVASAKARPVPASRASARPSRPRSVASAGH